MNEIDVLNKALLEYRAAKRIKNMNEELLRHLADSIFYLLKHSEKYNIPLPKKDELVRMLEKAEFLIAEIQACQPTLNGVNNQPPSKQNLRTINVK